MMMFASALPESLMGKLGKIHIGTPMKVKTRKELLQTIRPHQWQFLREDNGDLPEGGPAPNPQRFLKLAEAV
jgi:hypothetical protein